MTMTSFFFFFSTDMAGNTPFLSKLLREELHSSSSHHCENGNLCDGGCWPISFSWQKRWGTGSFTRTKWETGKAHLLSPLAGVGTGKGYLGGVMMVAVAALDVAHISVPDPVARYISMFSCWKFTSYRLGIFATILYVDKSIHKICEFFL